MPITADWIDALRAAFGREDIDAQIRRGMAGEPVFHAAEAGCEVGTRNASRNGSVTAAQMVIEKPTQDAANPARCAPKGR